jgi:hypothetical protein
LTTTLVFPPSWTPWRFHPPTSDFEALKRKVGRGIAMKFVAACKYVDHMNQTSNAGIMLGSTSNPCLFPCLYSFWLGRRYHQQHLLLWSVTPMTNA